MTRSNRHGPGDAESGPPLPSFIGFEARAEQAGLSGLDEAIRRSGSSENILATTNALSHVTPAIAIPYAKLLSGEDYNDPAVAVARNGFYFATVVGNYLMGNMGKPTPPPYPRAFRSANEPDGKQTVLAAQAAYLEERPTLRSWIDQYVPMLDQLNAYPDVATAVAALTLRDIEEVERQAFVDAETRPLPQEQ